MAKPALVIFLGGLGQTPAERLVAAARTAATRDSIDSARPHCSEVIVVTDEPGLPLDATIDRDDGRFHFGERLAGVIERHDLTSVVYMGGGSLPLFTSDDFAPVSKAARSKGVTNNMYSSDLVAFAVSEAAVAAVRPLERDNALARALFDAGVPVEPLPRTLATQMDIDGPTDLAVLKLAGLGGPRLREELASLDVDVSRYRAVLPMFVDTTKQIMVAGRVGSHAWGYLERETACRVRLFAEERGMEAEGRAEAGTARSLLGLYIEAAGIAAFFETLPQLCDAAFIDTRVLLAHNRVQASREERFLSDLGRWEDISEPFLRDFTRAAMQAQVPVLLGGHSLVSGGLMALNEHAWALRDAGGL